MTDATVLDRAARALKDEIGKALDAKPLPFAGDTGNWSAKGDMQTLDLEACVRAVLMAVREPGMSVWIDADCSDDTHPVDIFTSMIDTILSDGEGR